MKFSLSVFSAIIIAILLHISCNNLKANVDTLAAGVYTSIEQLDTNEPLHLLKPELVKYNTADIYFVKKVKLKLLKNVMALSDGKALYLCIGNYKGKKGFVKNSFENWFNTSKRDLDKNEKLNHNFSPGLYRTILNFKKPAIDEDNLQFEKKGSEDIYTLNNYTNQQLNNIIAAVNEQDLYLVTGSYLNQIAFVKNQTKGRYFYFETLKSTLIEASSSTIFNSGVSAVNATELLQQPSLKTVGILYDVKTNQLNLLTNNGNKNLLIMLPIIKDHPQILLKFINSDRQPEDCKNVLKLINATYSIDLQ